ncbi:NAD+ diphosphatase [Xanthobacter flavus]|uniref:NAD(+) diphosphatase n=1 Tax=Xanthobacter flavus TaxID=281 RepID=A0A9W6CLZ9_XANFL|nr:NAD(+) diphosphatase [Xanthobacter flavus]MDR6333332.1 NAD+ diphosphatase [Xanthobacter flavus]GLI21607.1 NADH pyrophosphatase [Xanthobacter flavus]
MSFISRPDLGAWPTLGYVDSPLDRACHLRAGAADLLDHPSARFYLLGGELVALKGAGPAFDPLFDRAEAEARGRGEALFLGIEGDGAPRFAMGFDPGLRETLEGEGLTVTDLRTIAVSGLIAPQHLGPVACGKALRAWHTRHGFCANCGAASRIVDAGWRRDCPSCGAQHFPRTDPVVIMLTARGDRCLLGRQPHFAPGMWSTLAGFVEPGETIEDAVRRETLEEAGVRTGKVRYLASQPWPFPMSLMIGCIAEATSEELVIDRNELEDARWFGRDEVTLMLTRTHPDGLFVPPPIAIAHHLIRNFIEGGHA